VEAFERRILEITDQGDVAGARKAAREFALSLGFNAQAAEEIVLAVSEVGSNLVKHAAGGTLALGAVTEQNRTALEIEAVDSGPGIPDPEQALRDGFSTRGSLGCGLGTVNRLMDHLEIGANKGRGTRLLCRRWLRQVHSTPMPCPLAFGVATRAVQPLGGNGDAFVIQRGSEGATVAVIDGLGHGRFAQIAAQAARQYVEAHFDQPMAELFRGVGRACRATRGVVMAAARFDWRLGKVTFASIGNVEARVVGPEKPMNFLVRRGVLGGNAPNPQVTEHEWQPAYLMFLYTDGLRSRWSWQDFPELANASAPFIAQSLLRALARDDDDATILVVRGALP
jgi:anti-sigma regulatory factor (Ser/Thr protein kinase)/serine/threonine protein phosphatase PrpC